MKVKDILSNTYVKAGLLVVAGLFLGWLIFHQSETTVKTNKEAVHEHSETENQIWTCAMHPQIRMDEPGDCPICGMELIPLQSSNVEIDDQAIEMSESAMKLAEVQTSVVTRGSVTKEVLLYGKIQVDERLKQSQTAHVPGRIEQLMINVTGEHVKKGQLIAVIYSPELITAQKELLEALSLKDKYPALMDAAREKLRNWKLSDSQISNMEKSGKVTSTFNLYANTSGIVVDRNVNEGDYISTGAVLFDVTDLSKVWGVFDAYESDLAWVSLDQPVEFTAQAIPGKTFSGKVSFIDPVIDPSTRIARVRIELNNPDRQLKPGMFINGLIQSSIYGNGDELVIPQTAVLWTGTRSVVYVRIPETEHPSFKMREITLGAAMKDTYVVLDGLSEGEEIVTNGTFSVDAAAQLAGKPSMMNSSGGKKILSMPGMIMPGDPKPGDDKSMPGMDMGGGESKEKQELKAKAKISQPLYIDKQAKETLKPLYASYLKWKDALTNDDFAEAQKMATNMKSALDKINMSLFKGDAHNDWMNYQGSLNKNLEHVQHNSDIEQLRKTFQTVSATMIEMTNTFNPLGENIYVLHCPMADNNKGADWLSKEKEIKNPYFGKAMLKCGEVKQEIK